jgi:hypothetical protein
MSFPRWNDIAGVKMEKTVQYFEDTNRGQYATVEDGPMIEFLDKLRSLINTEHVKIYWRTHHNYTDDCEMYYLYGEFPTLKHVVTIANACGAGGRRIWLEHRYQRSQDAAISPIYIMSPAQIKAFDSLFNAWMAAGQDVTESDLSVVQEIMQL